MHELQPAGITHLHNDTIPTLGGDTLWASGYSAYDKLSPSFRKIIDGREAVYASAHAYLDRNDPEAGPKHIERVHPLVRVHPATGWKALWVNRSFTRRIIGFDKAESDLILGYLFDVYERVGATSPVRNSSNTDLARTLISSSDSGGHQKQVRCGIIGTSWSAKVNQFRARIPLTLLLNPVSPFIMLVGIMKAANQGMAPVSQHWRRSHPSILMLRTGGRH